MAIMSYIKSDRILELLINRAYLIIRMFLLQLPKSCVIHLIYV